LRTAFHKGRTQKAWRICKHMEIGSEGIAKDNEAATNIVKRWDPSEIMFSGTRETFAGRRKNESYDKIVRHQETKKKNRCSTKTRELTVGLVVDGNNETDDEARPQHMQPRT